MTKTRLIITIVYIALVLLLSSPETIHAWQWDNKCQTLEQVSVGVFSGEPALVPTTMSIHTAGDCKVYSNLQLFLHQCQSNSNTEPWESPEDWRVTEVIEADLNRDGTMEYALLVWRPFAPWPIDKFLPHGGRITEFHNKAGLSAHLILVGWDGDEYRELWAGSALANPISAIGAYDIDGDGYEELIALEGDYDAIEKTGNITIWRWQGFGFTLLERMEGSYSDYAVYLTDQGTLILTD